MPRTATRRPQAAPETYLQFRFPLAGVNQVFGFENQPNAVVGQDVARTSPYGLNVRSFDPSTDRARGGARPGIIKQIAGQVSGTNPIQEITSVVVTQGIIPGTGTTATPFIGIVSDVTPPGDSTLTSRMGSYDPIHGVSTSITTLGSYGTAAFYRPSQISAMSFLAGGSNPDYSALGILENEPVTQVLGIVDYATSTGFVSTSAAQFVMSANGKMVFSSPQTLPFTADGRAACVVSNSTTHVVATLLRSTPGRLAVCGIDVNGSVTFTAANVATTSEPYLPTFTYQDAIGSAVSGTFLCINCPTLTGIVRCLVADGTSGSVIRTNAQIATSAGGNYRNASYFGLKQTIAANTTGVLAVPVRGDSGGFYGAGLAFIAISTGLQAFSDVTGIQSVPPLPTTETFGMVLQVCSDGTHFYVLAGAFSAQGYAPVVKKYNGATGALLWSLTLTDAPYAIGDPARESAIYYASGSSSLQVNVTQHSYSINPTTGVITGAGYIPSTHTRIAVADAGSEVVGATTASGTPTSGPIDVLLSVSDGDVKVAADGQWVLVTNGTDALTTFANAPVIRSFQAFGYVYWLDSVAYKRYSSSQNTMEAWTATAGTLPLHSTDLARLGCLWQGRAVLSGISSDPRNWFMSAISDPLDWDYSPAAQTAAQAVAGNSSRRFGIIGDSVTGMIPYSDDVLLFLCANSIYALRGNPMDGGRIDLLTNAIGGAFGNAWCMDPYGQIYFMSNRQGVYRMTKDSLPMRISQNIDRQLRNIDLANTVVRLQWDDQFQGVHVYTTSITQSQPATHYFFESRLGQGGAWWFEEMPDDMNPRCCHTFQGNNNAQQVAVIGSDDGYVRTFSATAGSDDGTAISSEVWIGPFVTKNFDDILMKDLQALMGAQSGPVTWEVFKGATAEDAFGSSESVASGTWTSDNGGRNMLSLVRSSEHAFYVKLTSTNSWSLESIRARVSIGSKTSRRGA